MAYAKSIKPPSILPHCGSCQLKPASRLLNRNSKNRANDKLLYSLYHGKISLAFLFLLILLSFNVFSQENIALSWNLHSGSGTWKSTGQYATGFSTGSSVVRMHYHPAFGIMSGGWNGAELNPEAYYEYSIVPGLGVSIRIENIGAEISLGDGEMRMAVRYSTSGFREGGIPIGQPMFFYTTSPAPFQLPANVSVSYPDTLRIRFYGWNAADPYIEYNHRNVVMTGILTGRPEIISNNSEIPETYSQPVASTDTLQDAEQNDLTPFWVGQFTSPGPFSWVCPTGVTCVKVECVGGGGRGGNRTNTGGAGGGGGGAYSRSNTIATIPGNTYYGFVGYGGRLSPTINPSDSWFGPINNPSGALVLAKCGNTVPDNQSAGGAGGAASAGIGDTRYDGGSGFNGNSGMSGGGGGAAGSTGNGNDASGYVGGAAMPLYGGEGGNGVLSGYGNGSNGSPYGGGGGGEKRDATDYVPGNGANGIVVITYVSVFDITPLNNISCGNPVVIGLSDSETGISYQLYLDGVPVGSPVNGTGNAISFGSWSSVGVYTVVATMTDSGCTSTMNGTVSIFESQTIALVSAAGTDNQTVCINNAIQTIKYKVGGAATGANVTGLPAGVSFSFSNDTVFISGTPTVSGNFAYTVTTTPTTGCQASATGNINVIGGPPAQPSVITGPTNPCINTNQVYSVTSVGGVTYTWTVPAGWTINSGQGTNSINVTVGANSGNITVTPSNLCGNGPSRSKSITVILLPEAPTAANSDPASICANHTGNITLTATGGSGSTLRWFTGSCGGTFIGSGTPLVVAPPVVTTTYYARWENSCGVSSCVSTTVTVNPLPVVTATPTAQTICSGGTTNIQLTSTIPSTNFTWTITIAPVGSITGASAGSGNTIAQTLTNVTANVGTVTYTVIPTANGCAGNPINVVVTVNPKPVALATPAAQTICSGGTTSIALSSATPSTTFSWTVTVAPPASITGASAGSGNSIAQTLTNTTANPATATYVVTPTANGCPGDPINVVVTVNPTPAVTATPPSQTFCSPGTTNISLSSATPSTTFSWTVTISPLGSITGASAGSGNSIIQTLTNITSNVATATYTITPTANGCSGSPINVVVTVKPLPVGSATPASLSICSGDSTFIQLNSTVSNTTFTWTAQIITSPPAPYTITGFSGCNSACSNVIEQTLINTSMAYPTPPPNSGPGVVRYTITPTADGCVGNPFTVDVTVNPVPHFFEDHTISWNSNFQQDLIEICAGGSILNDNDIDVLPTPSSNYFNVPGWSVYYEYSDDPAGPWITPPPGYWLGNYQWYLGTDLFSQPGIYYFRFTVVDSYGCASSSNLIELHVISTLTIEAAGPDFLCISGSPAGLLLEGAYVGGVSTTTKGGTWSITNLNPPNGGVNGTLTPATFQTNPATVTYTPPANYSGIVTLTLTSNDPDGSGSCDPITDTREITILPGGEFEACYAPEHWPVTNTPAAANGYFDDSNTPCQVTLFGSDTVVLSGQASTTDMISCAGQGVFSFDWFFDAPANKPVWHTEDQQANSGTSGTNLTVNRPSNIIPGDLIIVTIYLRRYQSGNIINSQGFTLIRKTTTSGSNSSALATVASFYKIATASEPNIYTFTLLNTNTSNWRIVASRVTGHNTSSPIGGWREKVGLDSPPPANWWMITIPGNTLSTTTNNSLLVAALSVVDNIQFPNSPVGMTTTYYNNSRTAARLAIEKIQTAGVVGDRAFYWPHYGTVNPTGYSSAAQMFVINAPALSEEDAAYYLLNGVPVFLSNEGGESGTVSIPVTAGTEIGFRVGTSTNTGGRGSLTIYNMSVPDPVPEFSSCPSDTITLECNANPTAQAALALVGNVSDVCYDDPVITVDSSLVQAGCNAVKTFNITATNGCDNDTTCTVIFSYPFDDTPPVVSCPGDTTVIINSNEVYIHPDNSWDATATDNCGIDSLYAMLTGATVSGPHLTLNGVTFNQDTTTVTWTAIDACGNISECSFEVIVEGTADIEVVKSGPATIVPGRNILYSILVTNNGPATAPSVTLRDTVPVQVLAPQFSDDGGLTWFPWNDSLVFAELDPGPDSAITILITGKVDCDATDFSNTAHVEVDLPFTDPDLSNNHSTVNTSVTDTLAVTAIVTNAQCPDSASINITVTGGTDPYTYLWSGPDSFTSTDEDISGLQTGSYTVIVTDSNDCTVSGTWNVISEDTIAPVFTPPVPFEFCVEHIQDANYYDPTEDIIPERPEYYLFEAGETTFDLLENTFIDNCCDSLDMEIRWRIDFQDGSYLPPLPDLYIIGQPSDYGADIEFPGDGVLFQNVVHTITYQLMDCNGNLSNPIQVTITIKPRPDVTLTP